MLRVLISITFAALLAACAGGGTAPPPQMGMAPVMFGTVTQLQPVTLGNESKLGVGAVVGAVAGGILGNQIGGGTGRTLATVGGAVAGGVVGQNVQNNQAQRPGFSVGVQLDTGGMVTITQPADIPLRIGDRVRIDGDGANARVRPL